MNEKEAGKICKCLRDGSCQKDCRQYIDYPDEHNCTLISVHENGPMTLRDIGERLGITHVAVSHIEHKALKKIENAMKNQK